MTQRLTAMDVESFYLEDSTTPMHVGSVSIFEPSENGFDYDRLVTLIRGRIAMVPRFRQRVRWVPGGIANPVWVDDESFDVTYHVRRSALPKPGTETQLRELVGRIMSRSLDRTRPLWELYLVEGLEGGRFAILSKTHNAMINETNTVDIGQVILDVEPEHRELVSDEWRPSREPSSVELMVNAVSDFAHSPSVGIDSVRSGIGGMSKSVLKLGTNSLGIASAAVTAARSSKASPLSAEIGEQRRYGMVQMSLDEFKDLRRLHGGTINDVVLTVVTGAFRSWLLARGESVSVRTVIKALVPVSVRGEIADSEQSRVAEFLIDLPVGEPDPIVRLQRISFDMSQHKESARMLGAEAISNAAGFAPPTLHSLGARLANDLENSLVELVITNVPGVQHPLYVSGAKKVATYPVVPLPKGQAVAVGLTSYNGGVFFGFNADRDAMPDIDVLTQCLTDAADELRTVSRPVRRRAAKKTQKAPAKRAAKK